MNKIEALAKLNHFDLFNHPVDDSEKNYVFLKKLEALGLIKFEEKAGYDVNLNGTTVPGKLYAEHHTAINALIAAGFRFVKA